MFYFEFTKYDLLENQIFNFRFSFLLFWNICRAINDTIQLPNVISSGLLRTRKCSFTTEHGSEKFHTF